ncbi:sensor histidine kinase [Microvirga rosea]|uniref:sensor histidine kinase n=1 Tax=Microvirga rosea TaxID=2715425 RepID=UPI001D09E1F8|nr:histidine kinase dimerization/phosphoacceptor domain -containing protein [Microvirga rosea]MCB8819023.1 response regulator [Microvirga rosea]
MPTTRVSPSEHTLRILLLEDSALDAELVIEALSGIERRTDITRAVSAAEFREALVGDEWDVILADYVVPGFDGLSALSLARQRSADTPFIFVSGTLGEEIAVEAMKHGATDYVIKQRLERLPATVLRALAEAYERRQRRQAQAALHRLLEERTALLHELDHRVKNNLQLLLSLVSIEVREAETEEVRSTLCRTKARLQALGTAHRDLYDGKGMRLFDVTTFARNLCEELTSTDETMDIRPEFDLDPVEVEAAKAAPIALLFNELVVNALAHAYDHRKGKLKLEIRKHPGQLTFAIADDAFSPREKSAARMSSAGTILRALGRQLEAVVTWPEKDPKILVSVAMPLDEPAPRP